MVRVAPLSESYSSPISSQSTPVPASEGPCSLASAVPPQHRFPTGFDGSSSSRLPASLSKLPASALPESHLLPALPPPLLVPRPAGHSLQLPSLRCRAGVPRRPSFHPSPGPPGSPHPRPTGRKDHRQVSDCTLRPGGRAGDSEVPSELQSEPQGSGVAAERERDAKGRV